MRCRTLQNPRSCENICSNGAKNIRSNKNNYREPRVGLCRRAHTAGTAPGFVTGFLRPVGMPPGRRPHRGHRGARPRGLDAGFAPLRNLSSSPGMLRMRELRRCSRAVGTVPVPPSTSQRVPVHAVPWRSVRPRRCWRGFLGGCCDICFFPESADSDLVNICLFRGTAANYGALTAAVRGRRGKGPGRRCPGSVPAAEHPRPQQPRGGRGDPRGPCGTGPPRVPLCQHPLAHARAETIAAGPRWGALP